LRGKRKRGKSRNAKNLKAEESDSLGQIKMTNQNG
jgi:hypothetical protein